MKKLSIAAAVLMAAGLATAKLPEPDEATKAKAAETSAKAAWQAKVDAFQLCKAQDKIAARYGSKGDAKPAAAAKPAASAAVAAAPAATAASGAASATSTPVAFTPPPPCADPGPFAYNPPEQKPLETSGAHSPAGTAASPPSVRAESAQMAPAKK
jgi:hypothetical protein